MSTLLGSSSVGNASISGAAKRQIADRTECVESGTVETLHVHTSATAQGVGTVWVSIFESVEYEAGKWRPGKLLGKGKLVLAEAIPAETWYEVALESGVPVSAGLHYHLSLVSSVLPRILGATGGASTAQQSEAATFTEPTETTAWKLAEAKGPLSFYGTGSGPHGSLKTLLGLTPKTVGGRNMPAAMSARLALTGTATGKSVGATSSLLALRAATTGMKEGAGRLLVPLTLSPQTSGERSKLFILGSLSEPVPTAISANSGKPYATRFPAELTAQLEQIEFHLSGETGNSATDWIVAIAEDGPEGLTPGTVLSEAKLGAKASGTLPNLVNGLNASLVTGRFYWLIITAMGGTAKIHVTAASGSTATCQGTAITTHVSETTWEASTGHGPMQIVGYGREQPHGSIQVQIPLTSRPTGASQRSSSFSMQLPLQAQPNGFATNGSGRGRTPLSLTSVRRGVKGLAGRFTDSLPLSPETEGSSGAVKKNVRYGPGAKNLLDIYPSRENGAPTVVFVHGGGWVQEEKEKCSAMCAALVKGEPHHLEQGPSCMVFNIEYHLASSGEGSFGQSVEDVLLAVEYAIANAAQYGGDPTRVFLIGASAGGHLVQMAGCLLGNKINAKGGIISLSGLPDMRMVAEELENQSNVNQQNDANFIKHVQWTLQENLPIFSQSAGLVGVPLTTDTVVSRPWQELWSATHRKVTSKTRWLIFSSELEVAGPAPSAALQAHIEAETGVPFETYLGWLAAEPVAPTGTIGAYNKRYLRKGGGHALAYWSEVKPTITSFIFSPSGEAQDALPLRAGTTGHSARAGTVRSSLGLGAAEVGGKAVGGGTSTPLTFRTTVKGGQVEGVFSALLPLATRMSGVRDGIGVMEVSLPLRSRMLTPIGHRQLYVTASPPQPLPITTAAPKPLPITTQPPQELPVTPD